MLKGLYRAKSDPRSTWEIAELHRLVLATSGPGDRNNLDAEALRRIEQALLNSQQPKLICLYQRLLTGPTSNVRKHISESALCEFECHTSANS